MVSEIRLTADADVEPIRRLVSEAYEGYIGRVGRRPAPMDADFRALVSAGQVWVRMEPRGDRVLLSGQAVRVSDVVLRV